MSARKDIPLAYSMKDAAATLGISLSLLYEKIAAGEITPKYVNSKPLIPAPELQAWLEALPTERA